jgi:hypothetical protein
LQAEFEEGSNSLLAMGAARMTWAAPSSGTALLLAAMEAQWHDLDALQLANDVKMQAASEVLRRLVVTWMTNTQQSDACEHELGLISSVSEQVCLAPQRCERVWFRCRAPEHCP